jgi:hypothetical protein
MKGLQDLSEQFLFLNGPALTNNGGLLREKSTVPILGNTSIRKLNIACHYTRSPRNYDLTIESTPGFVPCVTV